jgi:hypothetical protein
MGAAQAIGEVARRLQLTPGVMRTTGEMIPNVVGPSRGLPTLTLLAVLATGCSNHRPTATETSCTPSYEVYSSIIRQLALGPSPTFLVHEPGKVPVRRVVVVDHTKLSFEDVGGPESKRASERDYLAGLLSPSDQQLLLNLFDPAAEPAQLKECFDIEVPITFISEAEMDRLFNDLAYQGWKPFWKRYPDAQGILTFSHVSFNSDGTRALVYAGNQSGADMGSGLYLLLQLSSQQWVIERRIEVWVS